MRLIWIWIIAGVMVWPVSSRVTEAGGKPVDVMLSDFLILLMPFTYLFARSNPTKSQLQAVKTRNRGYHLMPFLALAFVVYGASLAAIGVGMSAETIRLYSAFKLVKPVAFVLIGYLLGSWTDPLEFLETIGRAYGVIVGLTMYFTVTNPSFPLGEWGKYIFEYELDGYPNMPMSTYASLVPLLLASTENSKNHLLRMVGWGLSACTVLIVLGSMSRSSGIALICGGSAYLISTGRAAYLFAGLTVVAVLAAVGFGLFTAFNETEVVTVLAERVHERLDRSTESEDPTSGRLEIWILAIELAAEKPIFGYMFEPFSHYYHFDTPHQQYLEVLYKAGGLGLFLYVWLLASCFKAISRLLYLTIRGTKSWYLLHGLSAMLIGILFGNLTQPNLTFSLTGNLVFLLFGSLCGYQAVISVSQPSVSSVNKTNAQQPVPLRRVAA